MGLGSAAAPPAVDQLGQDRVVFGQVASLGVAEPPQEPRSSSGETSHNFAGKMRHCEGGKERRANVARVRQPYRRHPRISPRPNEGAALLGRRSRMSIFAHPHAIAASERESKCANCHHLEVIIADLQAWVEDLRESCGW
jgi:hypothetical protein